MKRVLSIAGSDSGGGAGIQADLKSCAALGCFGMSAITATTAQNTITVTDIHEIPVSHVEAQIRAVLDDIGADAIKTGMLSSAAIIDTVATTLQSYRQPPLVVDPVMISKSGAHLLRPEAVESLKERLLPLATLITPNIPEAEELTGLRLTNEEDRSKILEALKELGPQAVLLKGGHADSDQSVDFLYDGNRVVAYPAARIETRHTHGTGCTLSTAIACYLARGETMEEAVRLAKEYLTQAIMHSEQLQIGQGVGPVHHGWNRG
ncbi:MAG: bifunctional hydroxymethylpyrimidine kinase/phosphomethylpyrimidine kinase [Candidatus Hydrogenedens sp.]|jgi:hydroxymethylpyrimidine/phosphomethylpyrimidine kinase|nr:bifunctional hydroxymethylpyrimidine kinase/phosphomethylpyrimidine kinase [Candidatus Hydrogenedens sp.]